VVIKVVDRLDGGLADASWDLYYETFKDVNALAVQRHLMFRSEFDEVIADERIEKYLCYSDSGELCGLSTYTNQLESMPLIAPEYFARRWPDHYRDHRIWYCGFVAVTANGRANHSFQELVEAMYLRAATQNGIISLDFCQFNDKKRHMSRVIQIMLHRLSGDVKAELMDQQSFWMYQFPSAA
jgi:hypothetical protein